MKNNFVFNVLGLIVVLSFIYGCASYTPLHYSTIKKGSFFTANKAANYDSSKTIEAHSYLIILQARQIDTITRQSVTLTTSVQEYISILELNGLPIIVGKDGGLTLNNIAVIQPGTHKLKVRTYFGVRPAGASENTYNNYDAEITFTFEPGKYYYMTSSLHPEVMSGIYNFGIWELRYNNNPRTDVIDVYADNNGDSISVPIYAVTDGIDAAIRRDIFGITTP